MTPPKRSEWFSTGNWIRSVSPFFQPFRFLLPQVADGDVVTKFLDFGNVFSLFPVNRNINLRIAEASDDVGDIVPGLDAGSTLNFLICLKFFHKIVHDFSSSFR